MSESTAQPLLTPASVASSLSAPRTPPHGTVLRRLYADPRGFRDAAAAARRRPRHDRGALASRLLRLSEPQLLRLLNSAPHPHLPKTLDVSDRLTRFVGAVLPVEFQHYLRDSGVFRGLADGLVTASSPLVGAGHWREVRDFLELSRATEGVPRGLPGPDEGAPSSPAVGGGRVRDPPGGRWTRRRLPYGDHPMQHCDLFLPTDPGGARDRTPVRGALFFVHGGAWGSGLPWMYRLVAPPFLRRGFAVAIAGYRTYPDAAALDAQRGDVRAAWERCGEALRELAAPARDGTGGDGWVGNVLMGHSSGAHVALLVLADLLEEQMSGGINSPPALVDNDTYQWAPDHFVGLSGVYDISHHYDYEAGRGVEQISPMQPICGRTQENFRRASPAQQLPLLLGTQREGTLPRLPPRALLVHGVEDATVPFPTTADAARLLRSCGGGCEEVYLASTGHQDVIMHLMLGGPARDAVLEWLLRGGRESSAMRLRSRL